MKIRINRLVVIVMALMAVSGLQAQSVQLNADPEIEQLANDWIRENRNNPGIEGWRVQLLSTTDRSRVEAGKRQFLGLYPTVPADWVHEKPYYKLRVGAFHTRWEAQAFLMVLGDTYPGAYPARDPNIHPRDFLE